MIYKKPIIFYNQKSGSIKKTQARFDLIYKKIISKLNLSEIEVFLLKDMGASDKRIRDLIAKKTNDLIIILGGDGTISSVCNILMEFPEEDRIPIFPIPTGSGNSLLLDLNINNPLEAIERFDSENTIKMDVIEVEEVESAKTRYCINLIGMGFISDIVDFAIKHKNRFGGMSYFMAVFMGLKKFLPYKVTIKHDSGKFDSDRVFFLTVSNTIFTGGKIMIAPEAKYDDSILDIIILHDINRYSFLRGFMDTFRGKHINHKGCTYIKSSSLEISATPKFRLMPDGELEGTSPIKIRVLPKQIKIALSK